jgi:hypothetical protein
MLIFFILQIEVFFGKTRALSQLINIDEAWDKIMISYIVSMIVKRIRRIGNWTVQHNYNLLWLLIQL